MAEALIETSLTGSPTSAGLGLMQRFLRHRQGLGFRGAREEAAREIAHLLATERPVDEVAQLLSTSAAYRRYVAELPSRFGRLEIGCASGRERVFQSG